MARHHDPDEERVERRFAPTGREQRPAPESDFVGNLNPAAIEGLADATQSDRTRVFQFLQQAAGNQAVQRALAAELPAQDEAAPMGAEGGPLNPALSAQLAAGRTGGQPIDRPIRAQLESSLGTSLDGVRIHTDNAADSLSRALSAKAFTSGSDIFFRRGEYEPGTEAGRHLLGHEVAHVVQQGARVPAGPLVVGPAHSDHESAADEAAAVVGHAPAGHRSAGAPLAGPTLSGAVVARQTDAEELRDAAKQAEKADKLAPEVSGMTNVADASAAKDAAKKVAAASQSLELARSQDFAGEALKPEHETANAVVKQKLDFYIGFSGEETRTGVDFIDRYKHAHSQFARLQTMAMEYEQMTGQSATTSTGLLSAETGATSGDEAQKKFGGLGGAANPAALAVVTTARNALIATETAMTPLKNVVDTSATAAQTSFKDVANATMAIKAKAEENTAKEKAGEVANVKAQIAEMQSWIASGIDVGVALGTAGVTGAMGVVGDAALSKAGAAAAGDAALAKGTGLAKGKAGDLAKQAPQAFGEFVATEVYKRELERARTGLLIANKLASGFGNEIGGNVLRSAVDNWAQNLRTLHDKSAEFDRLQIVLRDQIRQIGEAMDAAGMGKQEGARFSVIAEFRTESTLFVNEADLALTLGKQHKAALEEAGVKRGDAAYKDDKSPIYYEAYRWHDGRWRLKMNYLNLGVRQAAGEGGSIENVDFLLKELQAYRDNAERYRVDMAKAMGASI